MIDEIYGHLFTPPLHKEYFELDLDVPGRPVAANLGDGNAKVMRFVFDGWSGDQIVTARRVFLATDSLAEGVRASGLTGFDVSPAEIERRDQMTALQPDIEIPKFVWLRFNGLLGESDLVLTEENVSVVSGEALDVILATHPSALMYIPYEDPGD